MTCTSAAGFLLPPPVRSHAAGRAAGIRRRTGRTELSAISSSRASPPRRGAAGAGDGGRVLCTLGVSVEEASLSPRPGAVQSRRHAECLEKVRSRLRRVDGAGKAMATVDALLRLGIDYHFEEEVGTLLNLILESFNDHAGDHSAGGDDLHDVSLSFRLLRQGGFHVPTDPFHRFMDGQGNFKESISKDIPGLLNLYEASFLGVSHDHVLDAAHAFSQKHLKVSLTGWLEPCLAQQVRDVLDHPFHTSPQRYKIRRYLEQCEGRPSDDVIMLRELARLDFNIIQTLHRSELLRFTKWWNDLGISQFLMFARNQPVKWYIWSLASLSNPKFSDHRFEIAKCVALIYIIDDIFDVYGSLEELALFTEIVKQWKHSSEVDTLPSYMAMCYKILYDVTNEIACKVYREQGWNPINSLKRSWIMLFEAFLVEAKWFASGHIPPTKEYLRNGVTSSGVHVVLTHIFFLLGQNLTMDNITYLEEIPSLISMPATILRLWDDLGSAKDENQDGFDGSYIECYMREYESCSMTGARRHVMGMISAAWKNLNMGVMSSKTFSSDFLGASLNITRMIQTMYSYEGNQQLPMLQNLVHLLLFECV